jgi:hypothetical protein
VRATLAHHPAVSSLTLCCCRFQSKNAGQNCPEYSQDTSLYHWCRTQRLARNGEWNTTNLEWCNDSGIRLTQKHAEVCARNEQLRQSALIGLVLSVIGGGWLRLLHWCGVWEQQHQLNLGSKSEHKGEWVRVQQEWAHCRYEHHYLFEVFGLFADAADCQCHRKSQATHQPKEHDSAAGRVTGQFAEGITSPSSRKRQRAAASCTNARARRGHVVVGEQSLPLAPQEAAWDLQFKKFKECTAHHQAALSLTLCSDCCRFQSKHVGQNCPEYSQDTSLYNWCSRQKVARNGEWNAADLAWHSTCASNYCLTQKQAEVPCMQPKHSRVY